MSEITDGQGQCGQCKWWGGAPGFSFGNCEHLSEKLLVSYCLSTQVTFGCNMWEPSTPVVLQLPAFLNLHCNPKTGVVEEVHILALDSPVHENDDGHTEQEVDRALSWADDNPWEPLNDLPESVKYFS